MSYEITQNDIYYLIGIWVEIKEIAKQLNERGVTDVTTNDIDIINGELSKKITEYTNSASQLIDPANKDKIAAMNYDLQESIRKSIADDYASLQNINKNNAATYENKMYWKEPVWKSRWQTVKTWHQITKKRGHHHYNRVDRGTFVLEEKSNQDAINKYNYYTNLANYAGSQEIFNRNIQKDAAINESNAKKDESDKRKTIIDNYREALLIIIKIYSKINTQIYKISTEGAANAVTASNTAATTIGIDEKTYQQATSQDTKTLISTNKENANQIIILNDIIKDANNFVKNQNNSPLSRWEAAKRAETGSTVNSIATALYEQAKKLKKIAKQERDIQDEIDLRLKMRQDTTTFKEKYINDRLKVITDNFFSFYNILNAREYENQKELNTPIPQATQPEKPNENISAQAANDAINGISGTNGNYEFINFKIDAAVSYPLKCIGSNEYSNTAGINMTPLDNNIHTYDTCRISSNLANKPYYALVKPVNTTNATSNNYKCYVADSMPLQNTTDNDYVIIWEHGPRNSKPIVSNFALSTTGDFIITYGDNTTANISNITTGIYQGRVFELVLTESGNIEIRGYAADGTYIIAWESFSIPEVRASILDLIHYTPISNSNWGAMGAKFKLNADMQSSKLLISQNNKFKLEVTNDGNLQLKVAVYACKYTNPVNANVNLNNTNFLYTDEVNSSVKGQPYYVYANDMRLPSIQTPHYAKNAVGDKTLQEISLSHPALVNISSYDIYPSIGMVNDGGQMQNNEQIQTGITKNKCEAKCNNDPKCNYYYYDDSKQSCYIGKKNKPDYIQNNFSTLYIRKKKMIIADACSNIIPEFNNITAYDQYRNYASYKKEAPITSPDFKPGFKSHSVSQEYSKIVDNTIHGNIINRTVEGFTTINEGYDNYNYKSTTPSDNCLYGVNNKLGCHNAIMQNQIAPLELIARDYNNQISQLNANRASIGEKIQQYNTIYNDVNKDYKYDFNKNQQFTLEDTSIQQVMQQDTKQLLLQENNFYIAGSILTATLLIGAIYLAR